MIDVCGTGGDGKNTFNISTASAFVIAGAGYKVAKHGNYGVSSICGSSNVLQHLGVNFTSDVGQLNKQITESNICFLHAPLFHPALKSVGPIRKELGVKTFFNFLGPLVNPSRPTHQMVGVFDLKVMSLYKYIYEQTPIKYSIVHALGGYDEVSLTSDTKVIQTEKQKIYTPTQLATKQYRPEDIFGGNDISSAASIFTSVLSGNGTSAQEEVVCANAGIAIQTFHPEKSIDDCISEAKESVFSGNAINALNKLKSLC